MASTATANQPPRNPRALFIAAFAVAGVMFAPLKAPALPKLTPYRADRRDRSVRHIVRSLGRALIAGGRARDAFDRCGSMTAPPPPPPLKLDRAALAIMADAVVKSAIGQLTHHANEDDPWVEVNRDGVVPQVKIYWRGDFIQGERMARVWKDEPNGLKRIEQGQGETMGSSRTLDMARFGDAFEAARTALRRAGIPLSPFAEAKRVNTPTFKGAIATIGLRRENVLQLAPRPSRTLVR